MSQKLIDVWVDPDKFAEIARVKGLDGSYPGFSVALDANHTLLFQPTVRTLVKAADDDLGMIKVEKWKEGIVLWVGGEMIFKSWKE